MRPYYTPEFIEQLTEDNGQRTSEGQAAAASPEVADPLTEGNEQEAAERQATATSPGIADPSTGDNEQKTSEGQDTATPPGVAEEWVNKLLGTIPAKAIAAWTAIWPLLLVPPGEEIISENGYFMAFGIGLFITLVSAVVQANDESNKPRLMKWHERYYQYGTAMIAFAIWAYYLASIAPGRPITAITLSPLVAFVGIIVFVTLAPVLHTFLMIVVLNGKKLSGGSRKTGNPDELDNDVTS